MTVATVVISQKVPKEEKEKWMFRHKSLGLLTGILVAPRVAYRFFVSPSSYNVAPLPGKTEQQIAAGTFTYYALYQFMTIMPAAGIAMGYYGGKGLPFFTTTIEGAVPANNDQKDRYDAVAKRSYFIHKMLGTYGKFLVPMHVIGMMIVARLFQPRTMNFSPNVSALSAVLYYMWQGDKILERINPITIQKG